VAGSAASEIERNGESSAARPHVIAIGASAGGVATLVEVLSSAGVIDAPVLVVVHLPAGGQTSLPSILKRSTSMDARLARHGDPLEPGVILIAPPDHHLLAGTREVRLSSGPRENGARPAIDPLFRSVARAHGAAAVAVVLSGMLGDGAAGLAAVRREGGYAIVQEPGDALFAGMPSTAIDVAGAEAVLPASAIGAALVDVVRERVSEAAERPDEPDIVELPPHELQRRTREGDLIGLTCPECNGALWEHEEGMAVVYRCRVGHAFSVDNLDEAQNGEVEAAMWMAVRALEEQASLLSRSVVRLTTMGAGEATIQTMRSRSEAALGRAEMLRGVLASRVVSPTGSPSPRGRSSG